MRRVIAETRSLAVGVRTYIIEEGFLFLVLADFLGKRSRFLVLEGHYRNGRYFGW